MSERLPFTSDDPRETGLVRIIAAPRGIVWRCWTEPDLHKQWYCPKPWYVSQVEHDLRPGGKSRIVMNGPNGEVHDNIGQFLEVIEGERLVFTDAFDGNWRPAGRPFLVGVVHLEDAPGGQTKMTWSARHWTEAVRDEHLAMGFEQGWNAAADQLEELVATLTKAAP